MSLPRRFPTILLALFALSTVSVGAASALPGDGPDSPQAHQQHQGQDHGHHDRPFHIGPFQIPENGNVSGGFAWDLDN